MKFKEVKINNYSDSSIEIKNNQRKFLYIILLILLIILIVFIFYSSSSSSSNIKIINSSLNDKNTYKLLTLPNELEVLLIYDEETQISGASLAVNTGSFNDLTEGLAHLTEHVLFIGNEKYNKTLFQDTVTKYSGKYNAYTSKDKTVYFFEVNNLGFKETFSIWSAMFDKPNFDENYIEKETNAVNSEFEKNVNDNIWLSDFLFKQNGNLNNPYSRFDCGNLETFKNKKLKNEILSFFNTFYVGNNMKLVLYSNKKINEMEEIVKNNFNIDYKQRKKELNLFNNNLNNVKLPVYEDYNFKKIIYFEPSNDINFLNFYFIIQNSLYNKYEIHPEHFLFYNLLNENENSLINLLKKENLIVNIHSNVYENFLYFSVINIKFELNEKGLENYDKIIEYFFEYINLIKNKGINEDIYNDIKKINNNKLNFKIKESISEICNDLSVNMFRFKKENLLNGNYLHKIFDKKIINNFFDYISPLKVSIILGSKKNVLNDSKIIKYRSKNILPFYNKPFQIFYLTDEFINKLNSNQNINNFLIRSSNEYITKFNILFNPCYKKGATCIDNEFIPKKRNYSPIAPKEFNTNKNFESYFKIDYSFYNPIINIKFNLISIERFENFTSIDYYMMIIFKNIIEIQVKNKLNDAIAADNNIKITSNIKGIYLTIKCFSDLCDKILKQINYIIFESELNDNLIELAKDKTINEIKENENQLAFIKARQIFYKFIGKKIFLNEELLSIQNELKNENIKEYVIDYKQNIFTQFLIHGAINGMNSKNLINIFKINLNKIINKNTTLEEYPKIYQKKINGVTTLYLKNSLNDEINHVTFIFFQIGKKSDLKNILYSKIFESCIGNKFFDELRTVRQLGYIVKNYIEYLDDVIYFNILVQGSKKLPEDVEEDINSIIKEIFEKNNCDNFIDIKNNLKFELMKIENNLLERTNKIFKKIELHEDFNEEDNLIYELSNINSFDTVIIFFKNIMIDNPKRINIYYYGKGISNEELSNKFKNISKQYSLNNNINITYTNDINIFQNNENIMYINN